MYVRMTKLVNVEVLISVVVIGILIPSCLRPAPSDRQPPSTPDTFDPEIVNAAKAESLPRMREFAWSYFKDAPVKGISGTRVFWETWPKKEDLLNQGGNFFPGREWSISDLRPPAQFQGLANISSANNSDLALLPGCYETVAVPACHVPSITVSQQPDHTARYSRWLNGHIRVDVRGNEIIARNIRDTESPDCFEQWSQEAVFPHIPPFDRGSATVKAVWWPIKKNRPPDWRSREDKDQYGPFGCVPVWDGKNALPFDCGIGGGYGRKAGNDFSRWETLVAIDTQSKATGFTKAKVTYPDWSRTESCTLRKELCLIPIDRFHHKILLSGDLKDSTTRKDMDALFREVWNEPAEPGDALILVAVHLAVKELEDWVWITCWWHPAADQEQFGDHPPTLPKLWKNYLMDVTYRQDTPGTCDEGVRPIFNPWLEGFFKFGVVSNCMSCHQRAVWVSPKAGAGEPPSSGVVHGLLENDDPCFKGKLRLDYVWFLSAVGHGKP